MGNGGGGGDEDWGNGAGMGYAVQGSNSVGVVIWEQYLGDDRGHVKSTRGIPSLDSEKYCGDDGAAYDKRRVGVAPSGGSAGECWDMANKVIYPAEAGHCSGEGGLPAHI